jgi:hypothetical protein
MPTLCSIIWIEELANKHYNWLDGGSQQLLSIFSGLQDPRINESQSNVLVLHGSDQGVLDTKS